MLAALVYLADLDTENFCGSYTVKAAQKGISVASGALPRHISLGSPHPVENFEEYLHMAEEFAAVLSPLKVILTGMEACRAKTGNREVCWLGFRYLENLQLEQARVQAASRTGNISAGPGSCPGNQEPDSSYWRGGPGGLSKLRPGSICNSYRTDGGV